jgi:MSHA biogenesis protein MshG
MPYFAYKGRNSRGELVQGVIENSDSGAVADQLLNTGVAPIDIKPTGTPAGAGAQGLMQRLFPPIVALENRMLFSRQMYTLLKSGVPILRALSGLRESSTNPTMVRVLGDVRESLDAGRELSAAMRKHPSVFDSFYVSMVRVGEMTGRLDEVFLRLFEHIEFEKDIKARIKQAVRYPIFVIVAMVIAIALVNLFVIPAFAKLFAGFKAELPIFTRMLMASSDFTVKYWPVIAAVTVFGYFGFRTYVGTEAGRYNWDKIKLHIPVAGKIVEKAMLARFSRSFAMALRSGVPVVQSMSVVALVTDNAYIAQRIEQMRDGVERGESVLRTAMTTGVFTPVVLQMIAVGEETGELDRLLQDVAEMYEREIDYDLKNLSSQIEPILIVFLGILVLILALGVFLPIWDLGQAAMGKR